MRSKGHVYVVAESMYSDRPRIPMNPYTMKAHLLRTSAFNQGGPWDGPIRLRAPLVPWGTHREESTCSGNPANEGASFSILGHTP